MWPHRECDPSLRLMRFVVTAILDTEINSINRNVLIATNVPLNFGLHLSVDDIASQILRSITM